MKIHSIFLLIILPISFLICCNEHQNIKSQNIQIIELYVNELWNNRNLALADSIIGENFIDPASDSSKKGPESIKEIIASYMSTYPDIRINIDEIVADENKVAWKWTAIGTNRTTGKKESFSGIIIDKIEEGKIVQRTGAWK